MRIHRIPHTVIYTTGIFLSLQSFNMYTGTSYDIYLYMALPLAIIPLAIIPLANPCFYLLGTLLVVTGIVHLSPRLLVNCPLCPHCSLVPSPPQIPNPPGFPEPNVLLIRAHHNSLSSMRHSNIQTDHGIHQFSSFRGQK